MSNQPYFYCHPFDKFKFLVEFRKLLLKPDLVLKPEIAYRLMSHGMRTGEGFANGHRFSDYFHGDITDYVNARRMVNGLNRAHEIAEIAKKFEKILIDSKVDFKCPEPA